MRSYAIQSSSSNSTRWQRNWRRAIYRWAALNLRKASRLKPELLSRIAPAETVFLGPVADLDPVTISGQQGLYVFYDPHTRQTLYVGEACNLRKRLQKHLDHSDNKSLARWLWERGFETLYLEIHLLPLKTTKRARRALESELIVSRRAVFNVHRLSRRSPKVASIEVRQKQNCTARLIDPREHSEFERD
jgi:predicted GIY-YIG superfamily endonuclease